MQPKLLLAASALCMAIAQAQPGSDEEIRKVLAARVDSAGPGIGLVVGVIEPAGRRVIAYGSLAKDDSRKLDGNTLFEIGSVTKVFTALLLADMAHRGEVALTDPVGKYLPASVKMPERGGKSITLQDLATHTSGLPRLPSNLHPRDGANPYADYTAQQLYQFLSGYTLTRDPGSQWEYSNLGSGLLGQALALRAGMDYEALVKSRITAPLGMSSTGMTLSPDLKTRLAVGHNDKGKPVANWDFQVLAGAGALDSSANDMLAFLAAALGYKESPLAPAFAAMTQVRRPTTASGIQNGLGWQISESHGKEVVWKDGGTFGYRSFLGYDPKARTGVVVLANIFTFAGVNDIGMHLLDKEARLPTTHTEIPFDPKKFDRYVGLYQFGPKVILTVTRDGSHFYAQLTGQGKGEIFPESEHDFFARIVDAQFSFVTDDQGHVTEVVLHQNGMDQHAKRIPGEPPPAKQHKEITIDPKLFDRYTGQYQLTPGFVLTITREGVHLFLQATGQPKFEIFPESEKDFFLKVVDAQVTFVTAGQGRASELILHQNGRDMPAKRLEE